MARTELGICHIQYIIDHVNDTQGDIALVLNMNHDTVGGLKRELGIKADVKQRKQKPRKAYRSREPKKKNWPKPHELARWNGYDPRWTAIALERYGYGDMRYSEVEKLCR